jgi:hypothetical protein
VDDEGGWIALRQAMRGRPGFAGFLIIERRSARSTSCVRAIISQGE